MININGRSLFAPCKCGGTGMKATGLSIRGDQVSYKTAKCAACGADMVAVPIVSEPPQHRTPGFLDATHAALHGRDAGRLVACPQCVDAIVKALRNGHDELEDRQT